MTQIADKIQGCLIGGAAGDALGYAVEFLPEKWIFEQYGNHGIQAYDLDKNTGKALISDDTQMSLFTANGLLTGDTRRNVNGESAPLQESVRAAYMDWLRTQETSYAYSKQYREHWHSWLCDVPELYNRRAPGNTCLSALWNEKAVEHSKGCGGIMRVAPLALNSPERPVEELDLEGAAIAGITHGHPLGQMPAAVLTHVLHRIVYPKQKQTLREIVEEARDTMKILYADSEFLETLVEIINLALQLSENHEPDLENIHQLGEGWIAEETLAIALYCALRYSNDFSAGIIAAVNHRGDSDSTGAVTGNLLGALLGLNGIDQKWKQHLELYDVILEMANDLYQNTQIQENHHFHHPDWLRKYQDMRWK